MAWLPPCCGRIHPEGAINCEDAKEIIEKQGDEMKMRIIAHQENCDCPSAEEHLRKRDQEKQNHRGLWDHRPIGAAI